MSSLPVVNIGKFAIEVSNSHIYLAEGLSFTYDYMPWNLIGEIIREGELNNIVMVDIGANVGDSLAHFRRQSAAPVVCVEPDDVFFEILSRNAGSFSDVTLCKSLLVPADLDGAISFSSGGQTGKTEVVQDSESVWQGECTTFDDLLHNRDKSYVIKTDTDGFDLHIINSLSEIIQRKNLDVPVVFFEGPSADQLMSNDIADWCDSISRLQNIGYHILILNNIGLPYCYAGSSEMVVKTALRSLTTGYRANRAMCHYYDFIAVRNNIQSPTFRLDIDWGESLFRQY